MDETINSIDEQFTKQIDITKFASAIKCSENLLDHCKKYRKDKIDKSTLELFITELKLTSGKDLDFNCHPIFKPCQKIIFQETIYEGN